MSQCKKILRHLEENGSITSLEAIENYRILRLASRIRDLKDAGFPIVTVMQTEKNAEGETVTFARYYLKGEGECKVS